MNAVDSLQAAFDNASFATLPARPVVADSGWQTTPDRRQSVRLLAYAGADGEPSSIRFRARGEPLLLALANELCRELSAQSADSWPAVAELVWPFNVPNDSVALLFALQDAVDALMASAVTH
ncbi:MAG: hypothetical protein AAFX44_15055 [Pseudomonadota bacterium]